MTMSEIFEKLRGIGITPTQIVNLLAAVKSFDFLNRDPNGTSTITNDLVQGNLQDAYNRLAWTAKDLFAGGTKYKELMNLITKVGVVKLTVSLVQYLASMIT